MKELVWADVLEEYGRKYKKRLASIEELVLEVITCEKLLLDVNYFTMRLQKEFKGVFPKEEEKRYQDACTGQRIMCVNKAVEKLEKRCRERGIMTNGKVVWEALNRFYGIPVTRLFITDDNNLNREMVDNLLSAIEKQKLLG